LGVNFFPKGREFPSADFVAERALHAAGGSRAGHAPSAQGQQAGQTGKVKALVRRF
jgi:hypothetical protein